MSKTITGYHYTNEKAFDSMKTLGIDGYLTFGFDNFSGLIPSKRFINLGWANGLPKKAHESAIESLLESEPDSWMRNKDFPSLWKYLMHDICKEDKVILLSFELNKNDKAYVVERAHIERELYKESKGLGKITKGSLNQASKKYWESRIPIFDYKRNYELPQLTIWSGIEFERLKIEWVKPHNEVWKEVRENFS